MRAAFLPRTVAAAAMLAAVALLLVPVPQDVEAGTLRVAAVALVAMGLWATGIVPGHLAAIVFFLLAMLLSIAPAEVVFAGFHSTAVWLVFGGLILGLAIRQTGLAARLAKALASCFAGSYPRVVAGMVVIGIALAFVMPSAMGRMILLIPVVASLSEAWGHEAGSRGRTGLVIAAALGTFFPAFGILPANVANVVLAGAVDSLYGDPLRYGTYLLLHFPVLGLVKGAAIVATVTILFRDGPARPVTGLGPVPLSGEERRLAAILVVAVLLWVTDFVHHIAPAWIALAAGLACLAPRFGVLTVGVFEEKLHFAPFIYVAGVISFGAVVAESGLGDILAMGLIDATDIAADRTLWNYAALTVAGALLGLVTTLPGVPAVMTPLADTVGAAAGLPVMSVVMLEVVGFSTVILPYLAPPLVVAAELGGIAIGAMARAVLALLIPTLLVILPLNYLWWRALGYLP